MLQKSSRLDTVHLAATCLGHLPICAAGKFLLMLQSPGGRLPTPWHGTLGILSLLHPHPSIDTTPSVCQAWCQAWCWALRIAEDRSGLCPRDCMWRREPGKSEIGTEVPNGVLLGLAGRWSRPLLQTGLVWAKDGEENARRGGDEPRQYGKLRPRVGDTKKHYPGRKRTVEGSVWKPRRLERARGRRALQAS